MNIPEAVSSTRSTLCSVSRRLNTVDRNPSLPGVSVALRGWARQWLDREVMQTGLVHQQNQDQVRSKGFKRCRDPAGTTRPAPVATLFARHTAGTSFMIRSTS